MLLLRRGNCYVYLASIYDTAFRYYQSNPRHILNHIRSIQTRNIPLHQRFRIQWRGETILRIQAMRIACCQRKAPQTLQLVRCNKRQRIAPHVLKTVEMLKHTAQCLSVIAPYTLSVQLTQRFQQILPFSYLFI